MIMKVNPNVQQAKHLRIWYDAGGNSMNSQTTTMTPTNQVVKAGEVCKSNFILIDDMKYFRCMENRCSN